MQYVFRFLDAQANVQFQLAKYGAKPYEAIVICRDFDTKHVQMSNYAEIVQLLDDTEVFITTSSIFHKDFDLDPRTHVKETIKTTRAVLRQLGPWAAWKMSQMWEKQLIKALHTQVLPEKARLFFTLVKTAMITVKRLLEPEVSSDKNFLVIS